MYFVYSYSIPAIWIAWFIYWRAMAGNVKRTVRREPVVWRVIYVGLLVLGASIFTIFTSGRSIFYAQIYPQTRWTYWLGIALMLLGFAFTSWARIVLGRNWSSTVTMKENHELVEIGPYAWVRHPIYTGLLIMFLGTAVVVGQWRGVAAIILVLVSFLIKLRIEEKWMTELFGDRYTAYRRRVAMLIPLLW
jgi:protein-S-isoprenylcysteine O-methyltransferase Ste14